MRRGTGPGRSVRTLAATLATALAAAMLAGVWPAASGALRAAEPPRRIVLDQVKIVVNERILTVREVEAMRQLYMAQLRQQHQGAELQQRLKNIGEQVLEDLVETLLLESQAQKLGIEVGSKEVDERVDAIVRRDPQALQAYSEEDLKNYIVKDTLRKRVIQREVATRIYVDDASIRTACTAEARSNRELDVGHILVRGKDAAARARLEALRQKLVAGADFEQLAAAESEDPSAARNRGRLGYISSGQFVKAFEDAAFALPVGALSEPVESPFGLHLVRVFGERAKAKLDCGKLDDLNRDRLYNQVYKQLEEQRLKAYLGQLRKSAVIKVFDR
ncbi:MAG: peptidylprolyl isomerase [Candidatus Lambdaproteobacteria bacterium]|nr:peptidylprolyl isomerase [Candidatus Lambdaproteobacteria bacterium]